MKKWGSKDPKRVDFQTQWLFSLENDDESRIIWENVEKSLFLSCITSHADDFPLPRTCHFPFNLHHLFSSSHFPSVLFHPPSSLYSLLHPFFIPNPFVLRNRCREVGNNNDRNKGFMKSRKEIDERVKRKEVFLLSSLSFSPIESFFFSQFNDCSCSSIWSPSVSLS